MSTSSFSSHDIKLPYQSLQHRLWSTALRYIIHLSICCIPILGRWKVTHHWLVWDHDVVPSWHEDMPHHSIVATKMISLQPLGLVFSLCADDDVWFAGSRWGMSVQNLWARCFNASSWICTKKSCSAYSKTMYIALSSNKTSSNPTIFSCRSSLHNYGGRQSMSCSKHTIDCTSGSYRYLSASRLWYSNIVMSIAFSIRFEFLYGKFSQVVTEAWLVLRADLQTIDYATTYLSRDLALYTRP
jgi:hypothetical protein